MAFASRVMLEEQGVLEITTHEARAESSCFWNSLLGGNYLA
jgi:hypothetical protein